MKNRKLKKGFTLVELIVVIAIVAILAAVSVVSYIAFVRQANESADIQLVKQLNTSLQGDETLNGPRSTMHEMLGAMEENGFVVENLTKTKSGYDIVWDQEHNKFALIDNEEKVIYGEDSFGTAKKYNVWKFVDKVDEITEAEQKNHSVYLTKDFKTNVKTLNITSGFDAGDYVKLNEINYENTTAQSVTIRTNGGSLTVKAPNDTVKHYGEAQSLDIQAIDAHSYHEYGRVNSSLKIKSGRLAIESGAVVPAIEIASDADTSNLYIDNLSGNKVTAYTTSEEVENSIKNKTTNVDFTQDELVITGVAKIGDNYYSDIKEAFEDATESKIELLKDISISTVGDPETKDNDYLVKIAATQNITLDLLGHKLDYTSTKKGASGMINIEGGNLIINDTSSSKNGEIIYTSNSPDGSWSYSTDTIHLAKGSLTLNNGTIYNNTHNGASYTVDINPGTSDVVDVVFTMNGGTLYCDNGDQAVRLSNMSTKATAIFNMNDGIIMTGGFWLQNPGDKSTKSYININGGTVNGFIDLICLKIEDQNVNINGTAVINASKCRIRKYSNSRLLSDGSNAAQDKDPFVFVSCKEFNLSEIESNSTYFNTIVDYKKFISITSNATILGGIANELK